MAQGENPNTNNRLGGLGDYFHLMVALPPLSVSEPMSF